jgi:hypothetical protein
VLRRVAGSVGRGSARGARVVGRALRPVLDAAAAVRRAVSSSSAAVRDAVRALRRK